MPRSVPRSPKILKMKNTLYRPKPHCAFRQVWKKSNLFQKSLAFTYREIVSAYLFKCSFIVITLTTFGPLKTAKIQSSKLTFFLFLCQHYPSIHALHIGIICHNFNQSNTFMFLGFSKLSQEGTISSFKTRVFSYLKKIFQKFIGSGSCKLSLKEILCKNPFVLLDCAYIFYVPQGGNSNSRFYIGHENVK